MCVPQDSSSFCASFLFTSFLINLISSHGLGHLLHTHDFQNYKSRATSCFTWMPFKTASWGHPKLNSSFLWKHVAFSYSWSQLIAQPATHSPNPEISSFPSHLSLTLHFQLVNESFPLHLRSLSHHPQSRHAKSSSFLFWNFKISERVGWPCLDLSSTFPPESLFIFLHN